MSVCPFVPECISFGALISSTDPVSTLAVFQSLKVDPTLFYLVFGESALNDAIAITVFKVTAKFVGYTMTGKDIVTCFVNFCICFAGSCVIGYVLGILTALCYRYIDFKTHKLSAVALFVSTMYIPFLLAEALQLSGIVSVLFSGIAARRYVNKNLSVEARKHASFVFQLIALLAETSVFCLLGVSVLLQSVAYFKYDIILWTLALCYIGRAVHVYPLLSMVSQPTRLDALLYIMS
jgi:sodium/hydrogen exchanger 8